MRMAATVILMICAFAVGRMSHTTASAILFGIAYIVSGYDVLVRSAKNVSEGHVFDECFLMSIATLGAFAVGEYAEGAAVMLFYQIGEAVQHGAAEKSRRSVRELIALSPEYAVVLRDGAEKRVLPGEVCVGETLVVRAGERVPCDGIITDGASSVDTKSITGEPMPRSVFPGDRIYSGSIVLDGVITMTVEKKYTDSTVSRIMTLIEESAEKKSKAESFVTSFSRVYTPIVVLLALAVAFIPPIFVGSLSEYVHRGLVFLVVSCPCALVLSVPIAYFAGIGAASSRGILIKGGNYLDMLSKTDCVVFDKTGTLTSGDFAVAQIVPSPGITEERLTELCAAGESFSNHPIARSVMKLAGKRAYETSDRCELSGRGTTCIYEELPLVCGNAKLMSEKGIAVPENEIHGDTVVYVAHGGKYCGAVYVGDRTKPESRRAIAELLKLGVKRIVMLTGDSLSSAKITASSLGIKEYSAGLLPQDKAAAFEKIKGEVRGACVFVGDGINDAPVIAMSDVGFAMGSLGSDASVEVADVVIMNDDVSCIPEALSIAASVRRKVITNITFILAVKFLVIALSMLGYDSMWMAIFADVGTALLATINSARILFEKHRRTV